MGRTLYDKLWDAHLVDEQDDGSALIYIDRHLIHEVTSPQAFEGLRLAGRANSYRKATFAMATKYWLASKCPQATPSLATFRSC